MRRVINNILISIGIHDIVKADNGSAALRRLNEQSVDLIITDWNMPVMNGLDFVKQVRKEPRFNQVQIVMVSTENGKNEVAQAKGAGVCDMLKKPFSREDLKAMMARLSGSSS